MENEDDQDHCLPLSYPGSASRSRRGQIYYHYSGGYAYMSVSFIIPNQLLFIFLLVIVSNSSVCRTTQIWLKLHVYICISWVVWFPCGPLLFTVYILLLPVLCKNKLKHTLKTCTYTLYTYTVYPTQFLKVKKTFIFRQLSTTSSMFSYYATLKEY